MITLEIRIEKCNASVVAGTSPGAFIKISFNIDHLPSKIEFNRWPPESANPAKVTISTTFGYVSGPGPLPGSQTAQDTGLVAED
jgi:hypothetical protein